MVKEWLKRRPNHYPEATEPDIERVDTVEEALSSKAPQVTINGTKPPEFIETPAIPKPPPIEEPIDDPRILIATDKTPEELVKFLARPRPLKPHQ